ncbi:MAG: CoA transferase [Rhodocyclaceae bacterium]|nr:CoA transferase [Rhodocyclaceae bacterium]MCA3090231.1 CoA transferase [Rhodocyclaceae bacterium]MCA3093765.1 CoA transferase [Rhodocyclaceae bacterium]MCA3098870.1 CoA transferase [Rhodocyclaceae bacterium]MCA3104041.1 CoA transferase [Rhodocyclaceae bacterium]
MSHALPFADLRVVEFVHMVMGPTCGLVLGDMGAEVIKIEPLEGDHTRKLTASGAGFFPAYNRNKKSLAVDLKSAPGKEIVHRLVARADVVTENFRPGAMASLGFGYEALSKENPGLVYCSHKGFLRGPYAHRTALDEMAQMMGGLAYMTGPKGRPLRAGASVNDVMGGVFGAVAVMGALYQRKATGRGQYVESALYENNVFLMAQHMMESLATGRPAVPMPERVRAWAVYDTFTTVEGEQVFVGVVTDTQWKVFCDAFDLPQFLTDPSLATNPQRVEQRGKTIPVITELFSRMSKADLMARFEALGLPFAPIARPEDLFDDPHLNASDGLAPITLPDGTATKVPILPIEMDGHRLGVRLDLPKVGEHTREVLESIGYGTREIDELNAAKVIRLG